MRKSYGWWWPWAWLLIVVVVGCAQAVAQVPATAPAPASVETLLGYGAAGGLGAWALRELGAWRATLDRVLATLDKGVTVNVHLDGPVVKSLDGLADSLDDHADRRDAPERPPRKPRA